jgi:hypothetical protein
MATKRTQFRLSIVGNTEDVPRLIRGYGRLVSGEVAVVLRPRERKALLVRLATPDEALVWEGDGSSDYLHVPERVMSAKEAVKLAKAAQKPMPEKGSVTLRGTWTGIYVCDDGRPRIQLKRKLATYGTLFLTSSPEGGWEWEFQRSGKWFAESRAASGYGGDTLVEALQRAVLGAMEPVKEACSFRDTHRRREHDAEWAKTHPLKAKEKKAPKDPIERMKPPKPKKARKPKKKKPVAAETQVVSKAPAKAAKPEAKAVKPVPAPKRRKAPKATVKAPAKDTTLPKLQAAISAAADQFARRRPEPIGRFSEIANQDELDAFDADNAQVQTLAEQAIGCVSNEDLFRERAKTLKACFKPLADARHRASAYAGRRDNEFAAPFDLLRTLMKEEGVAIPRAKAPTKTKAPVKKAAKTNGNGKPAKANGNGKPTCAARKAAPSAPAEPAADPVKDQALLNAFSSAIAQVVKGAA